MRVKKQDEIKLIEEAATDAYKDSEQAGGFFAIVAIY